MLFTHLGKSYVEQIISVYYYTHAILSLPRFRTTNKVHRMEQEIANSTVMVYCLKHRGGHGVCFHNLTGMTQ